MNVFNRRELKQPAKYPRLVRLQNCMSITESPDKDDHRHTQIVNEPELLLRLQEVLCENRIPEHQSVA